ncbi:phage holin family protein [Chroogloeocystis siderophila]|jgi:putative membrane protein|uniref:Phage holin family protein n=1 Tax=Chroogloeocystis siderophila 5.2 s.c.1 TaxID=247279 RepID=A0A1U7HU05_9CHRO|nr:phage holin family protein [Chroogloeocystis siderophila]OKH27083.1 hypothetical protein NIES1031_10220 [Chroogloeocystis siderophila 5.2 s.c.1]
MTAAFFTLLATALSLLIVDIVVPGVDIATFPAALIAAFVIGVTNSSVKPALTKLALPLNYATLGLSSIVVNGLCFWLAALFVPGFAVYSIVGALLGPVILSFVNTFLSKYFAERNLGMTTTTTNTEVKS